MPQDIISGLQIPSIAVNELERQVRIPLDKCGMFYRLFSRVKSSDSVTKKIESKKYNLNGKKVQDIIGIRIACYFSDDISICCNLINTLFMIDNKSEEPLNADTFKPVKLNYVCKLPDEIREYITNDIFSCLPIDDTFEIQIRTVFSEGWHEIEHDMRYKRKEAWEEHNDLSRNLNGLLATLETSDWSILNIFDQLAYRNYKSGDLENMIRNKYRIRLHDGQIDDVLLHILSNDNDLGKKILQGDRDKLFTLLSSKNVHIPININNIIYCINELSIGNDNIRGCTPTLIIENITDYKSKCKV